MFFCRLWETGRQEAFLTKVLQGPSWSRQIFGKPFLAGVVVGVGVRVLTATAQVVVTGGQKCVHASVMLVGVAVINNLHTGCMLAFLQCL